MSLKFHPLKRFNLLNFTTQGGIDIKALIRAAKSEDVRHLSPRLREADLKELKAAGYPSAEAALYQGLEISDMCFTGLDPGTGLPAVMFGVVNTEHDIGYNTIWLLGTDAVPQHGRVFARYTKRWMKTITEMYGTVGNYVDLQNTFYVRWLGWLGFRQIATVRHAGTAFGLFIMEGKS